MGERKNPIASLPGAKPLEEEFSQKLIREMTEKAVPEVVETVEDRQLRAAESRLKILKRKT